MLQAAVSAENSVLDNLRQTHPILRWDEIKEVDDRVLAKIKMCHTDVARKGYPVPIP